MDRGDEQVHGIPGEKTVMRGIDGDRFRQNKPMAIALVPSRAAQVPEALATVGQFCRKLSMSGPCEGSLAIRCDTQAHALPKPKDGTRRVWSSRRGNQPASSADRASLAEKPDKTGWGKIDGSQRCQVHSRMTEQHVARARRSSRKCKTKRHRPKAARSRGVTA